MFLEKDGDSIQKIVHNMVQTIGGYWQPLSAVARILEEVGELAVEIARSSPDVRMIALELADLFIVTTCLANQYCIDLDSVHHEFAIPHNLQIPDIPDISLLHFLVKMCSEAGNIARIINYYEGDKPPKVGENISSLAPVIGRLHYVLAELVGYLNLNGLDMVKEVTTLNRKRDATRFSFKYDPLTALSVTHFQKFQEGASKEIKDLQNLWGGPQWQINSTLESNMQSQLPLLTRFCKVSRYEPIQAFVVELRDSAQERVERAIFATVNKVLSFLRIHDQASEAWSSPSLSSLPYFFRFAGQLLRIFAFVPCWNTQDPCGEEDQDTVFLLFVSTAIKKPLAQLRNLDMNQQG